MVYYNLGPENEQIEYKKTTSELKEGVISIAAILNKHGKGTLYFGVENNGDVIKESRRPIRRNPLITRTLYYSKDMESFATGLRRIQNFCDEAGVKVEYIGDLYGFTVRFYRHCGEGWAEASASDETNSHADSIQNEPQHEDGTLNGTLNGTLSHSDDPQTFLRNMILQNHKITRKQMADALGVSERSIQRLLNTMPDVHFTGGGRRGHWEIMNKTDAGSQETNSDE